MEPPTETPPGQSQYHDGQPDQIAPWVGAIVHYVSFGTPGGEYTSQCRAAIVTKVGGWRTINGGEPDAEWTRGYNGPIAHLEGPQMHRELLQIFDPLLLSLMVANPTGQFFNDCVHAAGSRAAADEPMRYPGGTWHWYGPDGQCG